MNQSIFITGSDPSSCLVCALRTLPWAHLEALALNIGESLVNTPEERGNREGTPKEIGCNVGKCNWQGGHYHIHPMFVPICLSQPSPNPSHHLTSKGQLIVVILFEVKHEAKF